MPPVDKLKLLIGLQLPSIKNMNIDSEQEETFATKISEFSNAIGLQLIYCWEQLRQFHNEFAQQAYNTLQEFLPFIFKLFADQDDQVSSNVVDFMNNYIAQLNKKQKVMPLSDVEQAQIRTMFQVVRTKARYTEDFIFEPVKQDEYEVGFLQYRQELFVVLKNATRIAPQIAKEYVEFELLRTLNLFRSDGKSMKFWDLEIALTLFYELGENFSKEINDATDSAYFRNLLTEVINSDVSFYPHESVQLAYFEIISRYSNLLIAQQQLIVPVLESFIDIRGLRNSNCTVQSRATYLFLKFVRTLQMYLHPFVEKLYSIMKDFLKIELNPKNDVLGDEKFFLYEALGAVLSHEKVQPQVRISILEDLLHPIILQMEEVLSKQLYKTDTPEKPIFSKFLAEEVEAVASLCKGFLTTKSTLQTVRDIFKRVLAVVLNILKAVQNDELIFRKIIFYFHIMIKILGNDVTEVFPSVISNLFEIANDIPSIKEVLVLFNQLISTKQEAVFNLANAVFLPMVSKIFTMIDNGMYDQESISEDSRMKVDLHKMYFTTLYTLLVNKLGNVLTSPKNISQFDKILETVIQGCNHKDVHIVRISFICLEKIVRIWGGELQGFENFVFTKIVPICFSVPLKPEFVLSEGAYNALVGEILMTQRAILIKYQADFINYLTTRFLPQAFGMNTQDAAILASQLQSGNLNAHVNTSDNKEMKKFFVNFFMSRK
jgi:exportin-T